MSLFSFLRPAPAPDVLQLFEFHNGHAVRPGQCVHCTGLNTLRNLSGETPVDASSIVMTCYACLGDTEISMDDCDSVVAAGLPASEKSSAQLAEARYLLREDSSLEEGPVTSDNVIDLFPQSMAA